jgi:hypothetical protein
MILSIGLSYTSQSGGTVYNVVIKELTGNALARTYVNNSNFQYSQNGASVLEGPAYRQKYAWTVSAYLTPAEALTIDGMFQAWDTDRGQGLPAAIGVTDELFGGVVDTSAVFTVPPAFTRLSDRTWQVDFAIQEA